MTRKYRIIWVAILVALVGFGVWALDRAGDLRWSGSFPLQVRLEAGRKVVAVWAGTMQRREWAEQIRQDIRRADCVFRPVEGFDGSTFTVDVICGGRNSGLGIERHYTEDQVLVLRLEYADQQDQFQAVEIPEGRGPRTVSVQLP